MKSKRLKAIAAMLEGYNSLVDIGTDHAYLPIALAKEYHYSKILATDINEGPLEMAKSNVSKYGLDDIISLKKCDGLDLVEGNYDVLSICGMGGYLIKDILNKNLAKLANFKIILLSPNEDAKLVREFMALNNYEIVKERIIKDYLFYDVIVFKKSQNQVKYSDLELKYGPLNLEEGSSDFIEKLERLLAKYEAVKGPYLASEIEEIKNILAKFSSR